jgi:DNA helicase-2/ATP-dependent DNA helicase PcrA
VTDIASRRTEDLLEGLTEAQRVAVTTEAAPLCILAAAGAGKTRVLTRRIAHRVGTGRADPRHVLALTFTRKAAAEMALRLRQLGLRERVVTGTFHAVASAQLRRWWADRGQPAPVLLQRKARLLAPLVAARPGLAGVPVADIAGQIEWARARLITPDTFEATARSSQRALPAPARELASVYGRYEDEKRRRGLIDFDDLLARCADAILGDPAFAAAQRWRWRHVFVDEFQDVNPLQHRLLLAWLGDSVDLCIVGDPNQAIYGWNGADPRLLAEVTDRWPTTEVVRLDANHRCSPQIVAAAAAVLGPDGATLVSSRPDGPAVTSRAWASSDAEAEGVAAAVRRAHDAGSPWSACGVLVRTNAQAVAIAEACRAASVPVRMPGGAALLDQPAARVACEELARRPDASVRVAAADLDHWATIGGPLPAMVDRGVSEGLLSGRSRPGSGVAAGDPAAARRSSPGDAGDGSGAEERAVLAALADLARHAARIDETMTVGGWLQWLPAALGREDELAGDDAVTVCTFHRAKGLEWSAVWVCGLEAGLVPIGRATSPAAEAEERRLLYVALTRARRELHCSWAEERRFGNRAVRRQPSPWLSLIQCRSADGPDDGSPATPPTPEQWQQRLREQRDRLRAGGPPRRRPSSGALRPDWPVADAHLADALRDWRSSVARASGVPAHVVLHDTVLLAVAATRPRDRQALLSVPGLGPLKADRYGDRLLALVEQSARSA